MTDRTQKEIDFSVFLLHKLAQSWGTSAPDAFHVLHDTGILTEYIIPSFDTLHTLGTEYLVDDITEFARERGANV